jgi:tetratricopeptide (TPR) repeat protein
MHNFIRMTAFVAVMAGMDMPAAAATQNEFYSNLLRRGMASYESSRYPDAAKQLRIAAFGLVDAIEQYQIAQMYLALTHDKLGESDRAREAAHRVIVAERVERKYAAATVAPAVRSAFETVAGRLLTPAEVAMLHGGPMPPATPPTASSNSNATPPRTTTTTTTAQTTAPPKTAATTPAKTPQTVSVPPPTTSSQPRVSTPTQQSQTAENVPPQTITPTPAPAKPKVDPPPVTKAAAKPAPVKTATTVPTESEGRGGPIEPPRPAPATTTPAPAPRPLSATELNTRLAAAERALNGANLSDARRVFRELLGAPGLDHDMLIRVAEGLYRSRDFGYALNAFNRIGALRRGEEPYRYYIAVAAYETGDYARAKKELAGALPFIEITPDVARYRTRIEGVQ